MNPLEKLLQVELTRRQFLQNTAALAASAGISAQLNNPAIQAVASALGLTQAQMRPDELAAYTKKWFLSYSSKFGAPWGYKSEMAGRVKDIELGGVPYDSNCKVTPLINGNAAMMAMRNAFQSAMCELDKENGFVYITDWRMNAFRTLSPVADEVNGAETVIGWLLRLMSVGIRVRLQLWLPPPPIISIIDLYPLPDYRFPDDFTAHIQDHFFIAKVIQAANLIYGNDAGTVMLDTRVTSVPGTNAASHHQKMMVVCVGNVQIAFCGGVDLAYTRRNTPEPNDPSNMSIRSDCNLAPSVDDISSGSFPSFGSGDKQSGTNIPKIASIQIPWEQVKNQRDRDNHLDGIGLPTAPQKEDLPVKIYGTIDQLWHDQHLQLEGPIVKTLARQFEERWNDKLVNIKDGESILTPIDPGQSKLSKWKNNRVYLAGSSKDRLSCQQYLQFSDDLTIIDRTDQPNFDSAVQMWRTIPQISRAPDDRFKNGEFTFNEGVYNACKKAEQLILIFDQYFWHKELAQVLNQQIKQKTNLHVIIILPPHADSRASFAHEYRLRALHELFNSLDGEQTKRVAVYNTVNKDSSLSTKSFNNEFIGIYCHAKAHTYDNILYVCGSANLNRRSFRCDSELACAVINPHIVSKVHEQFWRLLFPEASFPTFDWNLSTVGETFFTLFREFAMQDKSYLQKDRWAILAQSYDHRDVGLIDTYFYNYIFDPNTHRGENDEQVIPCVNDTTNEPTRTFTIEELEETALWIIYDFTVSHSELQEPQHKESLSHFVELISYDSNIQVTGIHGHASRTGNAQINERLSVERAKVVYQYLADNLTEIDRLLQLPEEEKVVGSGSRILLSDTQEERSENRRVEIEYVRRCVYETDSAANRIGAFSSQFDFVVSTQPDSQFSIGGQLQAVTIDTNVEAEVTLMGIESSFLRRYELKNPTYQVFFHKFKNFWMNAAETIKRKHEGGKCETTRQVNWETFDGRSVIIITSAVNGFESLGAHKLMVFPHFPVENAIWTISENLFRDLLNISELGVYIGMLKIRSFRI